MAFAPGQSVGEYQILSVLGAGGMGRVYRVRNVISDRVEAMKVLLPDFAAEPELAARFIAEIRTLASLDHPNIAQLHTACQIENQLVMLMEFVEGFTLEERASQGSTPPADVIEYTLQILSALSYAHARGVVHRDIKPANVMVTAHGVVKLMDFGIAKTRSDTQLTQPGTTLGSVYYMSPEQVRGAAVDARSDLYSVGILLYELLSGRRPFEADSTYNILNQQLNSQPTPPAAVNPQIPRGLNDLILFALAKDPAQRFQSADAFRNALCAVTGKAAAVAPVPTPVPAASAEAEATPWTPVTPAVAVSAAQPVSGRSGSQRALWVSVGAFAVVVILAAAAIGLPHFFRTGAASGSTPPTAQQPAGTPASEPQAASPASGEATPPPVTPATDSAVQPSSSPAVSQPQPEPASAAPARPAARPRYVPSTPASAVAAAGPTESSAPPPAASGPSPQELEQARDRKLQLDSRAGAVSTSLENLRRQQEADGYGLRQDIAGAATRMRAYLQAAAAELNNGNLNDAQRDMDRADKEISTLEAFFNK